MAVVCAAAGPPNPVRVAYAIYSQCMSVSTAIMSPAVLCQVCGVWVVCVPVLFCVVGYPLSAPPSLWWWVGALWMVGWRGDGCGFVSEGRGL